jgi:hypothetical protein
MRSIAIKISIQEITKVFTLMKMVSFLCLMLISACVMMR